MRNPCLLCQSLDNKVLLVNSKKYFHCMNCDLIYLNPLERLSLDLEKLRYLSHENNFEDERYRHYLKSTLDFSKFFLKPNMKILDWGTGPSDAFLKIMQNENYRVEIYDPIFFPKTFQENEKFDLIILSECIEHFYNPQSELNKIKKLMNKQSLLIIRTERHKGEQHFESWYYHRDPTHVIFLSENTFRFIADKFSWEISFPEKNISLIGQDL